MQMLPTSAAVATLPGLRIDHINERQRQPRAQAKASAG